MNADDGNDKCVAIAAIRFQLQCQYYGFLRYWFIVLIRIKVGIEFSLELGPVYYSITLIGIELGIELGIEFGIEFGIQFSLELGTVYYSIILIGIEFGIELSLELGAVCYSTVRTGTGF